ncbi:phosphatase PAP2 family protein [Indiicoccus explosivorum]|uniref:phosphatase PAP2 family protein n=1 Tax=Indiicoccus explosivorum TaxID=1917864 RepID=UPI000B43EE44|nr:phosphatase PAP2 family protein [Indiicoccus explosivorum]
MDKDTKKKITPAVLLLTGIAIAAGLIVLFAELAEEVLEKSFRSFDQAIIDQFAAWDSPALDYVMIFITELGSVWFLTVLSLAVVGYLWFKKHDRWTILYFIIAIAGSGILTWILKQFYQRERPSINPDIDAIGFSFPSGHSMGSLVFYGFLAYLVIRGPQKAGMKWLLVGAAAILALLIGSSRVYLSAHFPSDVLAGQLSGAIWLLLCIMALEWTKYRRGSKDTVTDSEKS